ncbi:dipeptidase PepV [Sporolactobacillus spathodeae]|uniref:Succinyl-diaminopimelate desuccinylase n=1 Tax=Sporolactobacillus spathodeae TaxID=1465502 RepID=A0ABS2QBJ8_9BACL|nr:dipeptidase PepV [Sporolactobacillus spathodeae]MBM7659182.1 succinyl-diaminopimelate desuccinylase [Sporolactobacillus spathodeae]
MSTINEKKFLEDLQSLIAIKSTRDIAAATDGAPFGPGPREALDKMLELGARDGFRTKNLQGYAGYIEYGPEDAEDYIAVLGHVDVVPATGNWAHDPFSVHLEDGTLYGRGVIDDKGPTMAAYYALKSVKESGTALKHRIRLVIGTDEESGCDCMVKYNELEPMSLFGFAPDAEFPLIFAEKGRIFARIDVPAAFEETALRLKQFYSGERVNMVPDQAYAVLSGAAAEQAVEEAKHLLAAQNIDFTAEKIGADWKLTVKGQSAHGSEPAGGVNAAFLLAGALLDLSFAAEEKAYLAFLGQTLQGDFDGKNLGIAFQDDVSGKLTVNAGLSRYESGKGGSVSLDIRCPIKAVLKDTAATLAASVEALGFSIGDQDINKPLYVDPKHPGVQILKHVYEKNMGQNDVKLLTSGGGTYAQYLDAGVAFGACMPDYPYTGHQVDEHVRLSDLLLASDIYADAIRELGNMEK